MKGVWEGTSSTPCAHLGATTLRKALAGLACRTNGLAHKVECVRAARAPTSPPTSPDSQVYVRCPKPSAKNGSRINCFHQERGYEGGKKLR